MSSSGHLRLLTILGLILPIRGKAQALSPPCPTLSALLGGQLVGLDALSCVLTPLLSRHQEVGLPRRGTGLHPSWKPQNWVAASTESGQSLSC